MEDIWRNTSVQFTNHCKYYQRYWIGPTEQNFLFYHRVKIFRPRANVLRSAMCQPQFDRIINSQTETTKIVLTFWKATLVRTKINKRLTRMYYVGVLIYLTKIIYVFFFCPKCNVNIFSTILPKVCRYKNRVKKDSILSFQQGNSK